MTSLFGVINVVIIVIHIQSNLELVVPLKCKMSTYFGEGK
jgi:hypothetical protein